MRNDRHRPYSGFEIDQNIAHLSGHSFLTLQNYNSGPDSILSIRPCHMVSAVKRYLRRQAKLDSGILLLLFRRKVIPSQIDRI